MIINIFMSLVFTSTPWPAEDTEDFFQCYDSPFEEIASADLLASKVEPAPTLRQRCCRGAGKALGVLVCVATIEDVLNCEQDLQHCVKNARINHKACLFDAEDSLSHCYKLAQTPRRIRICNANYRKNIADCNKRRDQELGECTAGFLLCASPV